MAALPSPTVPVGHAFFFGLGYTADRLGARLLAAGWRVSGTVRSAEKAAGLAARGIAAAVFDGTAALPAGAFDGVTHLVQSIPPEDGAAGPDAALTLNRAALRAAPDLRWVGYLSTPAVYGDRAGGWAREDEAPTPGSPRGRRRAEAEAAWLSAFDGTEVSVQVFRIAGIYGPGRSALDQIRAGRARIVDKPGQVFNRIHVDDIGSVLLASMARPRHGGIYNVADGEACPPGDPIRFAADLLGVAAPETVPFDGAGLSEMARSFYSECKRLDITRLRGELGFVPSYPSYREGLRAIVDAGG